jgi:hypothetical protein
MPVAATGGVKRSEATTAVETSKVARPMALEVTG